MLQRARRLGPFLEGREFCNARRLQAIDRAGFSRIAWW